MGSIGFGMHTAAHRQPEDWACEIPNANRHFLAHHFQDIKSQTYPPALNSGISAEPWHLGHVCQSVTATLGRLRVPCGPGEE